MLAKRWAAGVAAVFLLVASSSGAWAQAHLAGSEAFVRGLADRALASLTQSNLTEVDRRARFRRLFDESFAVRGIASYVVGRYWRQATPAQQDEFMRLFEDTLVGMWASRFAEYKDQKFSVNGATPAPPGAPGENAAIVRTELRLGGQTTIRVDWRVASRESTYKITDILVEGISMANTHRDEYASVLSRDGGIEALLKLLRQRSEGTTKPTEPGR